MTTKKKVTPVKKATKTKVKKETKTRVKKVKVTPTETDAQNRLNQVYGMSICKFVRALGGLEMTVPEIESILTKLSIPANPGTVRTQFSRRNLAPVELSKEQLLAVKKLQ